MAIFCFATFVVGVLIGILFVCLPTDHYPSQPMRHHDELDDVDEMVLWGEVNDDDFYRGK
jgi:uncharacterized membrane-anchored protein YhcB (DUF1043 family)